tara:strand:- start:555 stop:1976 length:1422 start_codon:yes stop_codon:yes gene_type:complete
MSLTGIEHLTPSPSKGQLFQGNYITNFDFTNQFLPDVYEKQAEIYGNRSIGGFLKLVSAEMPSASDEIRWVEQGRLHVAYDNVAIGNNNVFTVTLAANPDGTAHAASAAAAIRVGQTIMVQGINSSGVGITPVLRGVVTVAGAAASGDTTTFTAPCLEAADWTGITGVSGYTKSKILVYGSEFAKGTDGMAGSLDASYSSYTNKPMILKDNYQINGSDTAQIGWIEVTSENGASGYLWYLQSEHETRQRFEDYLEMSMIEAVKSTQSASPAGGTEGLFAALTGRGNVYTDLSGDLATNMTGFDNILKQLDKNGAIEENMLYIDKTLSLAIDDALAAKNSYGTGGTSYGVFNNSEEMALNLGFSGFRRGGYDFYKTDWKYLNDFGTRGQFNDVEGVIIPAGTSTVYDQELGQNIKRPFLHVRYRASETDDRKMKTWITGSVGGSYTTTTDEMRVSFLSERCLIVQGANNFVLLK